jgi:hypothetical protein
MLLNLDQSTVAHMTAALEHVCKRIPPENNSYATRKAIADSMLAGATAGARSLPQLQEIGSAKLKRSSSRKSVAGSWGGDGIRIDGRVGKHKHCVFLQDSLITD